MEIFIQLSGWIGTILILAAYFLVSRKVVDGQSVTYQLLNLVGAVTLGINVFYLESWPAVALNVAWATIAILSLINARSNKKTTVEEISNNDVV